jgi:hypothetical protein
MNNNDHNNTAGLCGASLDLTLHAIHAHPILWRVPDVHLELAKNAILLSLVRTVPSCYMMLPRPIRPFSLIVFFRPTGLTP